MAAILRKLPRPTLKRRPLTPLRTFGHVSVQIRDKVVVHGGVADEKSSNRLASGVAICNPYTKSWEGRVGIGNAPPSQVRSAASASFNNHLFTFGGYDGRKYYNTVHKLTLAEDDAPQWIEVCPQNEEAAGSPMAKRGAGMIVFEENLAVFGGYGKLQGPTQPGSSFIGKESDVGWTNEFHIYDLNKGMYTHCRKCTLLSNRCGRSNTPTGW